MLEKNIFFLCVSVRGGIPEGYRRQKRKAKMPPFVYHESVIFQIEDWRQDLKSLAVKKQFNTLPFPNSCVICIEDLDKFHYNYCMMYELLTDVYYASEHFPFTPFSEATLSEQ